MKIMFSVTPEDGKKINMIKEVRAGFGIGLKEAKDLVEQGGWIESNLSVEVAFFRQLGNFIERCAQAGLAFTYSVSMGDCVPANYVHIPISPMFNGSGGITHSGTTTTSTSSEYQSISASVNDVNYRMNNLVGGINESNSKTSTINNKVDSVLTNQADTQDKLDGILSKLELIELGNMMQDGSF